MIKLPQTERVLNQVLKKDNGETDLLEPHGKSGWRNMVLQSPSVNPTDLKVIMRKDLHRQSNDFYRWYRNLIIPKITVDLRISEAYSSNLKAVFSCFKIHGENSHTIEQVAMKGQIIQELTENIKRRERKKYLPQFDLSTHSKNLQFSQSHIENRQIFYCLCVTVCFTEEGHPLKEIAASILMPILVENRKQSLHNRTNQFTKFLEFLPIEFTRPLVLPQQESKDDPIFNYCLKRHLDSPQRIIPKTSAEWIRDARLFEERQQRQQMPLQYEGITNSQGSEATIQEIELSNDIFSVLIYLSSKTIRHKIFHPFFLLKRFGDAFEMRYLAKAFPKNLSVQEILKQIQERFLKNVFEFQENDVKMKKSSTDYQTPICFVIKPMLTENQDSDQRIHQSIVSQVVNYLQCIQMKGSLFVGLSEDIPKFEQDYLPVNFTEIHYKDIYDEISRFPLRLKQFNTQFLPQSTYSIIKKIDQSTQSCDLQQPIDHFRSTLELESFKNLQPIKALRPLRKSQAQFSIQPIEIVPTIRERNNLSLQSQTEIFDQRGKNISFKESSETNKTLNEQSPMQQEGSLPYGCKQEGQSLVKSQITPDKLNQQGLNQIISKSQTAQPNNGNEIAYNYSEQILPIAQTQQEGIIGQDCQLVNSTPTSEHKQMSFCSQPISGDFMPYPQMNSSSQQAYLINSGQNTRFLKQMTVPANGIFQMNSANCVNPNLLNFYAQNINQSTLLPFHPGIYHNQMLSSQTFQNQQVIYPQYHLSTPPLSYLGQQMVTPNVRNNTESFYL